MTPPHRIGKAPPAWAIGWRSDVSARGVDTAFSRICGAATREAATFGAPAIGIRGGGPGLLALFHSGCEVLFPPTEGFRDDEEEFRVRVFRARGPLRAASRPARKSAGLASGEPV